jgi:hypothetical protein
MPKNDSSEKKNREETSPRIGTEVIKFDLSSQQVQRTLRNISRAGNICEPGICLNNSFWAIGGLVRSHLYAITNK